MMMMGHNCGSGLQINMKNEKIIKCVLRSESQDENDLFFVCFFSSVQPCQAVEWAEKKKKEEKKTCCSLIL